MVSVMFSDSDGMGFWSQETCLRVLILQRTGWLTSGRSHYLSGLWNVLGKKYENVRVDYSWSPFWL